MSRGWLNDRPPQARRGAADTEQSSIRCPQSGLLSARRVVAHGCVAGGDAFHASPAQNPSTNRYLGDPALDGNGRRGRPSDLSRSLSRQFRSDAARDDFKQPSVATSSFEIVAPRVDGELVWVGHVRQDR